MSDKVRRTRRVEKGDGSAGVVRVHREGSGSKEEGVRRISNYLLLSSDSPARILGVKSSRASPNVRRVDFLLLLVLIQRRQQQGPTAERRSSIPSRSQTAMDGAAEVCCTFLPSSPPHFPQAQNLRSLPGCRPPARALLPHFLAEEAVPVLSKVPKKKEKTNLHPRF
eukprot:759038-Hanusia_phi.AAC.3